VALVVAIIHLAFSILCSVSFAMIGVAGIILPIAIQNRIFAGGHLYTGCDLLQKLKTCFLDAPISPEKSARKLCRK